MSPRSTATALAAVLLLPLAARALDYPYTTAEPQKTGWPLTAEERKYVLRPEHERRPGAEAMKHLPKLWPVVPSAGFWGGTSWLDTHARLVDYVRANKGPVDVLLVGDSITQQLGSPLDTGRPNDAWRKPFARYRTVNIGIGGDKTQNVLWRLDHGGVDGLRPRLVVLMIGNNNMFFTPETGVEAAAAGVQMCATNLRDKFPAAEVIVVKILPAHAPGVPFYEDIKKTNATLGRLKLDADPKVRVLDLTADFLAADGKLKAGLFAPDNIHLSPAGYAVYTARLRPLVDKALGGKGLGGEAIVPTAKPSAPSPDAMQKPTPRTPDGKRLVYPYAPYNEGRMDPQLTGWPLTQAEREWVLKGEYTRKPGHEEKKHLPEMWFVTPTAAHWPVPGGGKGNAWLDHHATLVEKVQACRGRIDVALIGDSITQGWGSGWDGSPFNAAWTKHFAGRTTVNLGIGGDRVENVLWRLDHGALDGAAPKAVVLLVGVNNAPLVAANGVPASAAARGLKLCVENVRLRCPDSHVVLVKVLSAFDPADGPGREVVRINAAVDALRLDRDPKVRVLDLTVAFTGPGGRLKKDLYADGHLHLSLAGYEVLAGRLKPVLTACFGPNGVK